MSRDITTDEDGFSISVNTFWGGTEKGECVQVTLPYKSSQEPFSSGYDQMTREEALRFFRTVATRLEAQVIRDEHNPPWWQVIDKRVKVRKAIADAQAELLKEFDEAEGGQE